MPEFETNGYGIAKFRRIFFGNAGDEFLSKRIRYENHHKGIPTMRIIKADAEGNRPPDTVEDAA
jgi:hypothetical protein